MAKNFPITLVTILAAGGIALTGCGGSNGTESTGQNGQTADGGVEPETSEITVADTAGMPSTFLEYGVEEGFFEDQGLTVNVDVSIGGAAAVPAVVSGSVQMAGSNSVSAIIAHDKGLPIQIVAAGTRAADQPEEDFARIVVPADSQIETVADLENKTVAVNTLENINDVTIKTLMDDAGADSSTVEFAEMGFPDMLPALDNNQVDAALLIEPFVSMAEQGDTVAIASPYVETMPELMVGTYLTSAEFIENNPETVAAFQRGLEATGAAIQEDPTAFRAALPEKSNIDPELAEGVRLPVWRAEVDRESLDFLNEKMAEYGLLEEPTDIEPLVYDE
ncbi:MAG TPA: ABC transporter substrate-binding protein [Enteractinococcus helveticum]|uniref:ABC transporter substrate-binding protein n=1 Tax=Enteractinococcus helveticum TaxID=1837282 RepID=A0A921FMZ1_9MICC|nr:ABC transporter substrate-binding protein [Enteractinococcus helveticum]HJF15093.1 ABC transporter substrate-binding protein [Enteractinococcus helveticum]